MDEIKFIEVSLSFLFSVFLLLFFHQQIQASSIMNGCQGEGCDCFSAYRGKESSPKGEIHTIRPFTLYAERSTSSKVLAEFELGTNAKPLKHEMVIEEKGEYIVRKVKDKKLPLKKGDKLDTKINLGEGFLSANKNGKSVDFESEQVELKTIKETKITEWLSVRVDKFEGFTQDNPFERCLE